MSENPAKLIGLQKSKGKIAVGYDADFVIWDDEKRFTVAEEIIQHKNKITPYINQSLAGVTEQTYLNGLQVFSDGQFTQLNKGKMITRIPERV